MKLNVQVFNEAKKKLYCRIEIRTLDFGIGTYAAQKLEVVYCSGEYEFELKTGKYQLEVYRGKLYQPFKQMLLLDGEDLKIDIHLKELLDTKSLNLYSFDAHSHVSRNDDLESGNLLGASAVMMGEDFNFFFAGSPYSREVHLQYLKEDFTDKASYREKFADVMAAVNSDSYILDIGNELVKCRYGHAFMMNYIQMPPFSKYYDHEFDPWLLEKIGNEPGYSIPYMYEALLKERAENSVAISAHPTSWWWHDNGEFITNISATLGFELLAGTIDAMVIMGYSSEKKYYQSLWYDALKNGYFLPGVAETDAAFDTIPGQNKLAFKTYTFIEQFNIEALCRAVRAGQNIVSSGPVIIMKVNGQLPGTLFKYYKGEKFNISIEAFRCFEAPLAEIQVIVNGEVRMAYFTKEGYFTINEAISIEEDSFILVKCYDMCGNLAITNPVYIRNEPFVNNGYLSQVTVKVFKDKRKAKGVYWLNDDIDRIPFQDEIRIKMKVASKLNISIEGCMRVIRLFELEELQMILKNLYFGYFNKEKKYRPSEVPAEEFQLARIKRILDNVELELDF